MEIKKGYYLQFLMPDTINVLGSTKNKINKDEIGESVPYLEIIE